MGGPGSVFTMDTPMIRLSAQVYSVFVFVFNSGFDLCDNSLHNSHTNTSSVWEYLDEPVLQFYDCVHQLL